MKELILQSIVALLGTISFSVLFDVPRRYYLPCGITGGVGWLTYLLVQQIGGTPILSTLIAATVISMLVRSIAAFYRAPTTLFLLCGIFTLVPGAGIYYTALAFFVGDGAAVSTHGADTLKTALAIAFGIIIAYSLPAKLFGWSNTPAVFDDGTRAKKGSANNGVK